MRLRPTPPAIPAEFLDRFGAPEHRFAPNVKFRVVAAVCGLIFLVMGVVFFALGVARLPLGDLVSGKLTAPLIALGAIVLVGARLVPVHWVFVCPHGLIRRRGDAWEGLAWTEVERFEDATLGDKMVTARQCRIVTTAGAEWGFLADQVAEFDHLAAVLRRKVDESRKARGGPSA